MRDTTKQPRYIETDCIELDSDDQGVDGPGLAKPFDPDSFYEKPSKELPEPLEKYTLKFFRSCLKDSLRKSMSKEHPLPVSTALHCLQADDSVKDFMGKSFPKKFDYIYKRIQSFVNAAAAPALNLWRDLHDQGFLGGYDNLMPVDTCLGMIQRTLVLVGNASNYISQCRGDNIIFKLKRQNPTLGTALGSICQEHQPGTKYLFGGEVRKALNGRAECLSSMKKVSSRLLNLSSSSSTDDNLTTVPCGPRQSHYSSGWSPPPLQGQLVSNNRGPLDPECGVRVLSQLHLKTPPPSPSKATNWIGTAREGTGDQGLEKETILHAIPTDPGYYSNLFIVLKKDGGSRPVIKLKALNSHLSIPHFKMEGTQNLKDRSRLHGQIGPTGCIPECSHAQGHVQIPEVLLGGGRLRVFVPPIQSRPSAYGFLQSF